MAKKKHPSLWSEKKYTAFLKNGTSIIVEGKNSHDAYKKLGFNESASQIIDFYVEGDFRKKYEFINNKWEKCL